MASGSGKSSGKSAGKVVANRPKKVVAKVVANEPVKVVANVAAVDIDFDIDFDGVSVGKGLSDWRIERNSNGQYRWRWNKKDENGRSKTYETENGRVGYSRGSKYITRAMAQMEVRKRGKRK